LPLGAILHGVPPVNMSVAAPNMSNRPSHCKEKIGKKILCMQFKRQIDLQVQKHTKSVIFPCASRAWNCTSCLSISSALDTQLLRAKAHATHRIVLLKRHAKCS
jgi:hypothetical protein